MNEFRELLLSEAGQQMNKKAVAWVHEEFLRDIATTRQEDIICIVYGLATTSSLRSGRAALVTKTGGYDFLQLELLLKFIGENQVITEGKRPRGMQNDWTKHLPWRKRLSLWLLRRLA